MNNGESAPNNVHQLLASAIAHHIERMSKEELQELIAKANLDLQNEMIALQQRVKQLEADAALQRQAIEKLETDKVRLYYELARARFSEQDWADFDPNQYTIPADEMLAEARKRLLET